ncbi:MAG: hypothetical protein LBH89_02930 [Lactococcus lactis]|jgi:hypothetical protein|nr:hypothetical protein [Lactococcus lactis]
MSTHVEFYAKVVGFDDYIEIKPDFIFYNRAVNMRTAYIGILESLTMGELPTHEYIPGRLVNSAIRKMERLNETNRGRIKIKRMFNDDMSELTDFISRWQNISGVINEHPYCYVYFSS